MNLRMLQSGCNYLKWVLSQHLTKQFRMFAQGTIFSELFFRKNIGDFYRSATMKKISTVIACKRNRFYFWNSCKRLQNFVNVEAL